ncbi:MAG: Rpn family recombination-promoting nuclease/putative transposase [Deltaproteobacteria bacterium]|jgi:predicted transposase/invertase (TIGR01784 family)|nr:Rpn family recombination-promoting nuclease/putative transposase [Deltaproteobacteria bacterium]
MDDFKTSTSKNRPSKSKASKPKTSKPKEFPSPLADPVFGAIFESANLSGLALKSLVNAILADSKDPEIGDVLTVTPQRVHSGVGKRGVRLDVEATTTTNDFVNVEVQLLSFKFISDLLFLYSQMALESNLKRGSKLKDDFKIRPRSISVGILDYILRPNGKNFHQVAELYFREEPRELLVNNWELHFLQSPIF